MTATAGPMTVPPTPTPAGVRAIGYLAAAGTAPYLALKVAWLSGSGVGFVDPALASDPSLQVANVITAGMDLLVVALALALTHRWGDRLPAWLVLIPMWVGTGLLLPITVSLLPAAAAGGLATDGTSPFQPWLQPVVYGSFAWQGVLLAVAFVLHARSRWPDALRGGGARGGGVARVLVAGAAGLAAVVVALRGAAALGADGPAGTLVEGTHAVLALAGAVGVLAVVHGWRVPGPTWLPVVLGWTGSAALFAWGTFTTLLALVDTVFDPTSTLTNLTGFASALAGLALAMVGIERIAAAGEAARTTP